MSLGVLVRAHATKFASGLIVFECMRSFKRGGAAVGVCAVWQRGRGRTSNWCSGWPSRGTGVDSPQIWEVQNLPNQLIRTAGCIR